MEEKSQEQIIFENTFVKSKGGFWNHYLYKSAGNILHWLETYHSVELAESVQIGYEDKVPILTRYGERYASVSYDETLQMPIFDFNTEVVPSFIIKTQRIFLEGLRNNNPFIEYFNSIYDFTR